jgi:hypothetical protein
LNGSIKPPGGENGRDEEASTFLAEGGAASRLISKSEFLSSLPPWRRFLAKLNWHPTVDAQLSAIESSRESEQLRSETERLRSETEQLRNETEQLKIENSRLAKLEFKLDLLLRNADSSSPIPPSTDCN